MLHASPQTIIVRHQAGGLPALFQYINSRLSSVSAQFEGMSEEEVDESARRAAEYFWLTARADVTSLSMTRVRTSPRSFTCCICA